MNSVCPAVILLLLVPLHVFCIAGGTGPVQTGKVAADTSWIWPGGDQKRPTVVSPNQNKEQTTGTNVNPKAREEPSLVKRKDVRGPRVQADPRAGFTFATAVPIIIPTTPLVTVTTTRAANNCTCVPYYYCDEGQVVSDGSGVIDIRNGWPCHSILEVCCRQPKPTPATVPPQLITLPPVTSTAIPGFTPRCGTLNPNGINARILGFKDSETQFGEYPWMAAILMKKWVQGKQVNYFVCGASLVWPSVVVTGAHCVQGKRPGHLIVRLGEWDTQSTSEFYPFQDILVKEIVINPSYYGGALYNDIALLFLERPAVLAPHIDTVCLPGRTPAYDNSSCWATGWGKNSFGYSGSYQAILREVELPIIPRTNCQEAFRRTNLGVNFVLHDSFLCAGGLKNQDTCVGDGGGPLVCPSATDPWRYVLAGIVSWGVNCGTYGVPGAYVDVTKFRTWIDTTIASRIPTYDTTRVTVSPSLG